MSPNLTETPIAAIPIETETDWKPSPPPTDLIFDDGEPLETYRHRNAMNVLIRSLNQGFSERTDFFTGGNMFVYFSREQAEKNEFRGPDFFVVLDIDGSYVRQGWVVWEEEGRYPDVIVELLSPSTAKIDLTEKKKLYERTFKTSDYYVYNPFDRNSLQGWHLGGNLRYKALKPNKSGWLWCKSLGLWLGVWDGVIEKDQAPWLRFYDPEGNLVLLPEEAAQAQADAAQAQADAAQAQADAAQAQLDAERQRAERLAARLRALGEDPDAEV